MFMATVAILALWELVNVHDAKRSYQHFLN